MSKKICITIIILLCFATITFSKEAKPVKEPLCSSYQSQLNILSLKLNFIQGDFQFNRFEENDEFAQDNETDPVVHRRGHRIRKAVKEGKYKSKSGFCR
ncbi:MAG: hypothetical protein H8D22_08370 [Candidatus Cloacimonetes bacterium]|nr:hypothetical protein [Candidatus Cloacimonadota bacterium]